MKKEVKEVLKNYKEIKYLEDNLNDFSLKRYLLKKGVEVRDDFNEDEFLELLEDTVDKLDNYPNSKAETYKTLIRRTYLDDDCKGLKYIAPELNFTYANAYKMRAEAINIITMLMRNKTIKGVK